MTESQQDQADHGGWTDWLRRRIVSVGRNPWFQAICMAAATAVVTSLTTKFLGLL